MSNSQHFSLIIILSPSSLSPNLNLNRNRISFSNSTLLFGLISTRDKIQKKNENVYFHVTATHQICFQIIIILRFLDLTHFFVHMDVLANYNVQFMQIYLTEKVLLFSVVFCSPNKLDIISDPDPDPITLIASCGISYYGTHIFMYSLLTSCRFSLGNRFNGCFLL